MEELNQINWDDPKGKISKYFTVHEALWLPSFGIYAIPTEEQKQNIYKLASIIDKVRDFVGRPIHVNCWLRPIDVNCKDEHFRHRNYNALVGGAPNSAHTTGEAVDFCVSSMVCDEVRYILQDKLAEFSLRMENKPKSNWVHLDIRELRPGGIRFFRP